MGTTADEIAKSEGIFAGVIHRNSMILVQEGPWNITDTVHEVRTLGHRCNGTCSCCGQPIVAMVTCHNRKGDRITLGLDCAVTLDRNGGFEGPACRKALARANDAVRKARNARATQRRREREEAAIASAKASAATVFAAELGKLDALVASSDEGTFAWSFARDVARRIRSGHQRNALSEKQQALIERLLAEVSAAA